MPRYQNNHLATGLRESSIGNEHTMFAKADDGARMTYGELFAGAERIARVLVEAGVKPGDRVAVQAEKSLPAVQLYLASVLAGGVFLPFNPAYTRAEMEYFLADSAPAVLVHSPQNAPPENNVRARFTLTGDGGGSLLAAANAMPDGFESVARDADDLAAILYTSGTTGRAKGAMLSHKNLAVNARSLCALWRFTAHDVLLHALPIFHTHGLFVALNIALLAGAWLRFMARFDAAAVCAALPDATAFMGVPTHYVRLLECDGLRDAAAGIRLFTCGSAPLSVDAHARWRARTGHAILERYGLTETGMNTSNPFDGERRAGSIGLPLPGVELRIAGEDAALPAGEVGMIEVRGENVFCGYWGDAEKTRAAFRDDGFFVTGDLGFVDADGYVCIVGRAGDVIISGGYNVYPREVENALDEVEGVVESAVVGLPHDDFGECVAAVMVCAAGVGLDAEEVRDALRGKLAGYKLPKRVCFVDELPRNAMGKVRREVLREGFGN